jgi:hypothetical protein
LRKKNSRPWLQRTEKKAAEASKADLEGKADRRTTARHNPGIKAKDRTAIAVAAEIE